MRSSYPRLSNEIKGHYIDGALYQEFYKTFDERGIFQESAYPQIQRYKQRITSLKEGIQRAITEIDH